MRLTPASRYRRAVSNAADAAAQLDVQACLGDNLGDDCGIGRRTVPGALQIDDVDPLGPRGGEVLGDG